MRLKSLELFGFKSFAKKTELHFTSPITAVVGPNGSGKSNVAEAFRFVLGEQSIKSLRGRRGEDLIWNGSKFLARQNRASVSVVFDNHDRFFNVDSDEVRITRIVHRDGVNEYRLGGIAVRLKDLLEILGGVHIGPSGHHIISQGEADRVLSASEKERREMIEEALGLKIYIYKKLESEKKLLKTRENITQVENLRRELSPHLKFLRRQVERIEKSQVLKETLVSLYREYFKREEIFLRRMKDRLGSERAAAAADKAEVEAALLSAKKNFQAAVLDDQREKAMRQLEGELKNIRESRDKLLRELGAVEGELKTLKREEERHGEAQGDLEVVPWSQVEKFLDMVTKAEQEINKESDPGKIKLIFSKFKDSLIEMVKQIKRRLMFKREPEAGLIIQNLKEKQTAIQNNLKEISQVEEKLSVDYRFLRESEEKERENNRDAEREVFRLTAKLEEVKAKLSLIVGEFERFNLEEAEWQRELNEALILAGRAALDYHQTVLRDERGREITDAEVLAEPRDKQLARRRELEKLKIKIEELGGGGSEEVMKKYQEALERDQFLTREIADLEKTAQALTSLIAELELKLDVLFKEGIRKINTEFKKFFELMFGGGEAELVFVKNAISEEDKTRFLTDDLTSGSLSPEVDEETMGKEERPAEGLDIKVVIPNKRIKNLQMLSGGERALTSIALLFAVSQVNPPPFIILDETDAALDEANSRKYANMIEDLSKKSQLILITHNRETMSRAGVIYGVTMGGDGISKLLSIQFEEAVKVAK